MKFLLITLLTLSTATAISAQIFRDSLTGKWTMRDVVQFDSMSKQTIFEKTNEVLSTIFPRAKEAIQVSDKEAGLISVVCLVGTGSGLFDYPVEFTLNLNFRENKMRYTATNFVYTGQSGSLPMEMNNNKKSRQKVEKKILSLIETLRLQILSKKSDDGW